jgi:mannosylglycerate hydrolase
LLYKETGRQYRGLHGWVDEGDVGDTYDACPLPGPDTLAVLRGTPEVTVVESGPLQAALRIEQRFEIPAAVTDNRRARSKLRVALPVTSLVRLRAGSPYLEFDTALDNQACDHRLRLLFPTGISSDLVHADGQMSVASRPVKVPAGVGWVQPPSGLKPHATWFAIDNGTDGLAVLSQGLHEHEALRDESGLTLALTLVRSVGWLSRGDLATRPGHAGPAIATPDAQCPGLHTFRYGLLPYRGEASRSTLPQLAAEFDSPLVARPAPVQTGTLPPRHGFVSLEPEELVLSAVKRSESGDRLVLRCYNAASSKVSGRLRFGMAMAEVWQSNAEERLIRRLDLDPDRASCKLEAEASEIVTLLLVPASAASKA